MEKQENNYNTDWKKKAIERAKEINKLQKRLKELEESRDKWKNKAEKKNKQFNEKGKIKKNGRRDIGMKQQ